MHEKFELFCKILSDTTLNTYLPTILKPIVCIIVITISPPLILFFGILILMVDGVHSFIRYEIKDKNCLTK
jgi:hypothetical protein